MKKQFLYLLLLGVALSIGNAWGDDTTVECTGFATSQSGTTYTVSVKSGGSYGSLDGLTVTTNGSGGGNSSGRLKIPKGTLTIAATGTNVIKSITITWRDATDNYPSSNSDWTSSPTGVSTSSKKSTWSGSSASVVFSNTTSNTFQITKLSVTYGTAGAASEVAFASATPSINFPASTTYSQVATTADGYIADGGSVSYSIDGESDNTCGATIAGSTVSVTGAGVVTIIASATATSNFASSTASYTLTVVDTRDASSIAFTTTSGSADMKDGLAFALPALTKTPSGASVTYSSSVPAVASVNETTGAVTLRKPGTAVITASFAGDEDYKPGSGTYTLTVTNSAEVVIYSWEGKSTGAVETGGTIAAYATDGGTDETASVVNTETNPSASTYDYYNTVLKGKKDYSTNVVKVTLNSPVKAGDIIRVTAFRDKDATEKQTGVKAKFNVGSSVVSTTTGYEFVNINSAVSEAAEYGTTPNTITLDVPADVAGSTIITMTRAETGTNCFITKFEIVREFQSMSISSATWATFSCTSEVAIPDGVTAYFAKQVNGSTVSLKEISTGIIPANTGVVLHGDEGDYAAYFTSTSATLGETNLLKPNISAYALPATTVVDETTYYNYTLAYEGGSPVFKHSTGSGNLAAGKAYLQTTINAVAGAPSIIRIVDEEENATVIENIESSNQAVKFFENGQLLIRKGGVVYDTMGRVIR